MSEWAAETDLRSQQTHLVSLRRAGSQVPEGTGEREAMPRSPPRVQPLSYLVSFHLPEGPHAQPPEG